MADSDDLELASEDDPTSGSANGRGGTHPVRKRINIKLRPSSKSRNGAAAAAAGSSSGKKAGKPSKGSHDAPGSERVLVEVAASSEPTFDDDDVNKAIEFSPVKMPGGNSSEPFHKNQKLMWNQKVNLLGEKVVDPLIHSCEKCTLPILIYGRMIPCKHVFCFSCAKLTEKSCPRCNQAVTRIEQSALGTVFVCTFGGTKHGVSGCHRTYLSQRDLQSHIAHRHYGGGREAQPPRPVQPTVSQPAVTPPAPSGVPASISYSVSQSQPPATSMTHDTNAGLVYRTMQHPPQHPPPQGPPNSGIQHLVITRPPPSLSQPPPQMTQPPPQHLMSSHGTSHVMNAPPPGGPPGMMAGPHVMPPHGMPPPSAMMVQSMPPMASRSTNLITVQLHEDADFRVDSGQNAGSSGGRVQLPTSQPDNTMTHYPPPPQQYPPPGAHVPSYSASDHHQLSTVVRPMMTHPPPLGPGQAQMGPGQAQMGPGPVMVTYSLQPSQMGPPPSGPAPRLGPPPQLQQTMPPQAMHSGPPPQGMMAAGPPPQGMMPTGPPPQGMPPPQAMHGAPPQAQSIRTGPPPQGYAAPPPLHPDQRPQFVGGQPLAWTTGPPPSGPPQMQHMGQRPSPGNMGSSQSMQYYQ